MSSQRTSQQRILLFEGNVQGVGFRYTACRVAAGHEIAGTVRNLPDGRVECVAEGRPEAIDAFRDELQERMRGHVRRVQEQTAPASGRYSGFQVAY
jgi:acylphosphatase